MRYSLLSRFRGTLIGATIEGNGAYPAQPQPSDTWGKALIFSSKSLIRLGKFDLEDWNGLLCEFREVLPNASAKAIILTLPVALFYHENEVELRRNLSLAGIWQNDSVLRDCTLAVGYAISQSLTERLNPATLIAQTIAFLREPQAQLAQQMVQVQTLLEQGAGLERAVKQLRDASSTPIAMAFYCFLSTTEDFRLSVFRAAQTEYQPQITTAITGALSGAYNSVAGIPVNLRLAPFEISSTPLEVWGNTTETEMLHLSDSLLAAWSGMYNWTTNQVEMRPAQAIAAPRVMRLR